MKIDPEIRDAIIEAPPGDPREIALELSKRFKKPVPISAVIHIRGSLKRAENVAEAKEKASEALTTNLEIMGMAKETLVELFNDESIPLKLRLEVSKELRQWTSMENAAAGMEDRETDTLFVIGDAWAVTE